MVLNNLKMVAVDRELHDFLKQLAAKTSAEAGRNIPIREVIGHGFTQGENALQENKRLRQQLENVDLDEEYKKKFNQEIIALENRAVDKTQELVEYLGEILGLMEETAEKIDALASDSVEAQKLVLVLKQGIFARKQKMFENAGELVDHIRIAGKNE